MLTPNRPQAYFEMAEELIYTGEEDTYEINKWISKMNAR